jgi:hypothetical protein
MSPFALPIDRWLPVTSLSGLCLPWSAYPDIEGIDPYLPWLDASHFLRNYGDNGGCPETLRLLVKVTAPDTQNGAWHPSSLGAFGNVSARRADVLKYRSGFAVPKFPIPIPIQLDVVARAGIPRTKQVDFQPVPFLQELLAKKRGVQELHAKKRGGAPTPVMAIVDDGCPFAHTAYRLGSGTRVIRLWDQGAKATQPPPSAGYGREWKQADLDGVMAAHKTRTGEVDEDACYRALDPVGEGMNLAGAAYRHGAHVMGLAAGAPDPWDPSLASSDSASGAPIIFVSLPRDALLDTSGGALAFHVHDALRYIDALTCERDSGGKPIREIPVAVCLALGASAGPHDGSALIEQAIGQIITTRSHAMVVAAAGNGRDERLHAHLRVEPGHSIELPWDVAPDDATDSFLELWWSPAPTADGDRSGNACLTLRPPNGAPSPEVHPGSASFALNAGGDDLPAVAGIVSTGEPSALGDARCALLVVAATAAEGLRERKLAASGDWIVTIRNDGHSPIEVDAYVERDDPAFGGRAAQSRIADSAGASVKTASTLGSLSHRPQWLVAGGYLHAHQGHGDFKHELDDSSGEGPGRDGYARTGPDLVAPGGDIDHIAGVLSYGVHSAEIVRARGTSASAAFATRRLYNRWCTSGIPTGWLAIKDDLSLDMPTDPLVHPVTRAGRGWLLV